MKHKLMHSKVNKHPGPDSFKGELCQKYREALTSIILKLFQKTAEGKFPNAFYEATLIPKPDKYATKKGKLQANITDEHRWINSQQNCCKLSNNILQRLYILTKWALFQ